MLMSLRCRSCDHAWQLGWEPGLLAALSCPACRAAALPRASEDFAAAVQDALSQLHWLGQAFSVQLQLSDAQLPDAFVPQAATATPPAGPP